VTPIDPDEPFAAQHPHDSSRTVRPAPLEWAIVEVVDSPR
jgi:hypothetical protein